MKAIQINQTYTDIEEAIENLHIVEKPKPKPGPGQVLVKVEAAPCNPSDLLFLQGNYGVEKTFPTVPGWEGAGTVVESGGGVIPWWLKGRRVAFAGQADRDGTWAEYAVADAKGCIPLQKGITSAQGSTLIINPFTAVGLIEEAGGHRAIIQTAALSQVGRMIQILAKEKNVPVINIVRRDEQVEELKESGAEWALNSEKRDFAKCLKELAGELNATIAFDAVAGKLTEDLFQAMPPKSRVLVYGALSGNSCKHISPLSLIFESKILEGFWLTKWIEKSGFWHTLQASRHVQELMKSGKFETKIREQVSFEGWQGALRAYQKSMTSGKVILSPKTEE